MCRLDSFEQLSDFANIYLLHFSNKLDENDYAIKRILLDPRNERLNQKIMREAKLFSKLTHENIVRYYCAWIESVSFSSTENGSDSTPSSSINQSTANRRDGIFHGIIFLKIYKFSRGRELA